MTKLFCPPTVWIRLLRSSAFDRHDLSSLRTGYYGAASDAGEPVLKELGERLPDIRLFNYYGQTELAPHATLLRPEEQITKAGSAGRACLNVETRLHDENDHPVPVGEVGEIVHRRPARHARVLGQAGRDSRGRSRKRVVPQRGPRRHGRRGLPDDRGPKEDLIITGGENVASREVEDAIYEHPDVSEVAVFGVAHPEWIEAVAAAVVLRDGADRDTGGGTSWRTPGARRRLQGAQVRRARRRAAEEPQRQDPQARAARHLRGARRRRGRRRDVEVVTCSTACAGSGRR